MSIRDFCIKFNFLIKFGREALVVVCGEGRFFYVGV